MSFFRKSKKEKKKVKRFSELENNPDWNQRANIVADWLKKSTSVLDIGCGTQYVKTLVSEDCLYKGVDFVYRDDDTYVIDLNNESLPRDMLSQFQTITFFGVLEYLNNPLEHLKSAFESGQQIIFTYTPIDYQADRDVRTKNDWSSNLSIDDLNNFVRNSNVEIDFSLKFDNQVIFVVQNKNSKIETSKENVFAVGGSRPSFILSGFFGRGNLGDEAILSSIYEELKDDLNIIISVDRDGAYPGFWDWYPYNQVEIIHHNNLVRVLDSDIRGLHVGGGGLPVGFNGSQVTVARTFGKPIFTTGVDSPILAMPNIEERVSKSHIESELRRYDWISVRSQECFDSLSSSFSLDNLSLGGDWAVGTIQDDSGVKSFDGVYLVVRELPLSLLNAQVLEQYAILINHLQQSGIDVRLLPFCPEDERFIARIHSFWGLEVDRAWWNPRHMKELIASSKGVISVGRLHSVIIAADAKVPCVGIDIADLISDSGRVFKLENHCREFGIPFFHTIQSFIEDFDGFKPCIIPEYYELRRRKMIEELREKLL